MADADRVAITVQEIRPGASDTDVAFTAGDATNGHYFVNDGQTVLLMQSSAGSKTATVKSVTCPTCGGTNDIAMAPAAGKVASSGFLKTALFNQQAASFIGRVFIDLAPDATGVTFAAVRFVKD